MEKEVVREQYVVVRTKSSKFGARKRRTPNQKKKKKSEKKFFSTLLRLGYIQTLIAKRKLTLLTTL